MKILFLSSNAPKSLHTYSHNVVLNSLILEAGKSHDVFFATTCMEKVNKNKYFNYLGDFLSKLEKKEKIFNLEYKFKDDEEILGRLRIKEMDLVIIFWDTWFDLLDFGSYSNKVISYLAKPRFSNDLSKIFSEFLKKNILFFLSLKKLLNLFNLLLLKYFHYKRIRNFKKNFNICNVDSNLTNKNNVICNYCPNTWPDYYGDDVLKKRKKINFNKSINILGNIGNTESTGNKIGLRYLKQKILPNLKNYKKIKINICGRGSIDKDFKNHRLVKHKGFVKNINLELLKNQIFLLCNNTGYHYGGYTRVIFMMSSAGVLIADKQLKKSMPELSHMKNCLLSNNENEMLKNIDLAIHDNNLRDFIGKNARLTYEKYWTPAKVFNKIIS